MGKLESNIKPTNFLLSLKCYVVNKVVNSKQNTIIVVFPHGRLNFHITRIVITRITMNFISLEFDIFSHSLLILTKHL